VLAVAGSVAGLDFVAMVDFVARVRSSMNPVSQGQGSPTAEWFHVIGATWVQLVLLGSVEMCWW